MMIQEVIVLIVCVLVVVEGIQTNATTLGLSEISQQKQPAETYQYYASTFTINSTATANIALNVYQQHSTSIYLSIRYYSLNELYSQYPDASTSTHSCFMTTIDNCLLQLTNNNNQTEQTVTIYFSVYTYYDISYELELQLLDKIQVNTSEVYELVFHGLETVELYIDGMELEGYDQMVVLMKSGVNSGVGSSQINILKYNATTDSLIEGSESVGTSAGAYNKMIIVKPISPGLDYYVFITAELNTNYQLSFRLINSDNKETIDMNSTVIYESNQPLNYQIHTSFENSQLPIFIYLDVFAGNGKFNVNYCDGLFTTIFQNINGQNGQIIITPQERNNCQQKMGNDSSFGFLSENLQISLQEVNYLCYQIDVSEGQRELLLRMNKEQFGEFMSFQIERVYTIAPLAGAKELKIIYNQMTESNESSLYFQLQECVIVKVTKTEKCLPIMNSNHSTSGSLIFTPKSKNHYYLNITYQPISQNCSSATCQSPLEYSLQLLDNLSLSTSLKANQLYLQELIYNQYNFYTIDLAKISKQNKIKIDNYSKVTIITKQINGDVTLLTSLTIPEPTYEMYLEEGNDILHSWSGMSQYEVDESSKFIYVGVKGEQEALYYIHFVVEVNQDLPIRYVKLADSTKNDFVLTKSSPFQLLSFSSTTVPFKIIISGNPSCIRYGTTLPLNETCNTFLPLSFTDNILYMNISNGKSFNSNHKFSVYANSDNYILTQKNPLLIGCIDKCFELVSVVMEGEGKVIHLGLGQVYLVENELERVSNGYINLNCSVYPCEVMINASLPFGGQMSIFLENQEDIVEISWSKKPITFSTSSPRHFIYPVRGWSEGNSIIINCEALSTIAYYNIIDIHQEQTNILAYNFPNQTDYQQLSQSNPLRQTHILTISPQLIDSKKCRMANAFCIAAISVYPNLNIQFNWEYLHSGIGYISSNTFNYIMPVNMPRTFNEDFGLNYFNVVVNSRSLITIDALSNCNPLIYLKQNQDTTDLNYISPSYGQQPLLPTKPNTWTFAILTQQQCNYIVSLSNYTQNEKQLQMIIPNKEYYLMQVANNSLEVLYYYSSSSSSVTRSFQVVVESVGMEHLEASLIQVYEVRNQGSLVLVGKRSNRLMIDTNNSQSSLYKIVFTTTAKEISFSVDQSGSNLLTNAIPRRQILSSHLIESYHLYTDSSFDIKAGANQSYSLTVTNQLDNLLLQVDVTSNNLTKFNIQHSTLGIQRYNINIQNKLDTPLHFHVQFQEINQEGDERLYQGIIKYDSLPDTLSTNCYHYPSQLLLAVKSITFDLVYSHPLAMNSTCKKGGCGDSFTFKVLINGQVHNHTTTQLHRDPLAYRIEIKFLPLANYSFCFSSNDHAVINEEYYVMVNDLELKHLVEDVEIIKEKGFGYDRYMMIEQGFNDFIAIQLTKCNASAPNHLKMVSSSSFIDSELGRYNDVSEYRINEDVLIGKLQVEEGYYYVGVKSNQGEEYKIRYNRIGNTSLLLDDWSLLKQTNITIDYLKDQQLLRINLPPIIYHQRNHHPYSQIQIQYQTYIAEMQPHRLESYVRCPTTNNNNNGGQVIIKHNRSYSYQDVEDFVRMNHSAYIDISLKELPANFNLNAKVSVIANEQTFSYYYQTVNYEYSEALEEPSSHTSIVFFVFLIITMLVITGAGVFLCIKKRKRNQELKKVAFELANFNHSQEPSGREPRVELMTSSRTKGYGQFVDEIS